MFKILCLLRDLNALRAALIRALNDDKRIAL